MARDPFLWPFAATNPWNLPIARGAAFEQAADAKTAALTRTDLTVWINQWQYSIPVYRAGWNDPTAKIVDRNWSARNGSGRVPVNAQIAQGTDRNLTVAQPGATTVHEMFSVTKVSDTEYNVGRHEVSDLKTGGFGPRGGVRASGASTLGGLIRDWEINPAHPNYTGVIPHAIVIGIDARQLYYAGGPAGYTTAGYGTSLGYVWPATEQDSNASSVYKGVIPMGTYFAIPGDVDLTTLGLTPQGLMLARAFQDYGGYAMERTGGVAAYVEAGATPDWRQAILDAGDMGRIRAQWRVVTNNSASTPNGGATYDPRRAPIAPYL
jgi:hypothetical protein